LPVLKQPHGEADLVTDASRADEAQNGGGAHTAFKRVQRVSRHIWKSLRPDAAEKNLCARGSRGLQGLQRPRINIRESMRVYPAQHAGVSNCQSQSSGERSQTY